MTILEEYNNVLIQQNHKLKRLLADSDKGPLLHQFSSPVKRKIEPKKKKPSKCKKLKLDSDAKKEDSTQIIQIKVQDLYNLRSGTENGCKEQKEIIHKKKETTPTSFKDDTFTNKGARRSLESIIEAINQLEGEEWLNSSFEEQ